MLLFLLRVLLFNTMYSYRHACMHVYDNRLLPDLFNALDGVQSPAIGSGPKQTQNGPRRLA